MRMQGIEGGLLVQAFSTLLHKVLESFQTLATAFLFSKFRICPLECIELERDNAGVIDPFASSGFAEAQLSFCIIPPCLGFSTMLELFNLIHVDIGHVEPTTRRWTVGAGAFRISRIERMNRV